MYDADKWYVHFTEISRQNLIFISVLINTILRFSFIQLCNTNSVWEILFMKVLGRLPSPSETKMASEFGWKDVLFNRLIYIQKIYAERNVKRNFKPTPSGMKILQNRRDRLWTELNYKYCVYNLYFVLIQTVLSTMHELLLIDVYLLIFSKK